MFWMCIKNILAISWSKQYMKQTPAAREQYKNKLQWLTDMYIHER